LNVHFLKYGQFFTELLEKNRARNLDVFVRQLEDQDFFCIDELAEESEEFFQKEPYYLSQGNSKFIVKSIKQGMAKAKNGTPEQIVSLLEI
jgi:hypothetical protein